MERRENRASCTSEICISLCGKPAMGFFPLDFTICVILPSPNLYESGASEETIQTIAEHVSHRMLSHHAHIRVKAKRTVLEAIVSMDCTREENRRRLST